MSNICFPFWEASLSISIMLILGVLNLIVRRNCWNSYWRVCGFRKNFSSSSSMFLTSSRIGTRSFASNLRMCSGCLDSALPISWTTNNPINMVILYNNFIINSLRYSLCFYKASRQTFPSLIIFNVYTVSQLINCICTSCLITNLPQIWHF